MNTEHMLAEIRDANIGYLTLAQNLVRMDRDQALPCLGISEESADMLLTLSAEQLQKVASRSTLLCRFRIDDDMVWGLLTDHGLSKAAGSTSRLFAGRVLEAA